MLTETKSEIWEVLKPDYVDAYVDPDRLSDPTIGRISKWMEICDSSHEKCRMAETSILPTRVLDVGDIKSSDLIKVVETKGQRGKYVALSHCWGVSQLFVTTRENLLKMKDDGFQLMDAPATFRDAIVATRKLKIRYLWIDSLCILQDDAEDWRQESSRMCDIYCNADITIVSARAASDVEGFLANRSVVYAHLKLISPSGRTANIYLREDFRSNASLDKNYVLDTRAWMLQERWLSRRQLRFAHQEILWDCQENAWRESMRDQLTKNNWLSRDRLQHLLESSGSPYPNRWCRLVDQYTQRHLTKQSDIFPALSGLAEAYANHKGYQYCAGIWWEEIGESLCWTTIRGSRRPESYLAPSWSWASIVGHARHLRGQGETLSPLESVTYLNCQVNVVGRNPYGQVDSGWLQLKALRRPVSKTDHSVTFVGSTYGGKTAKLSLQYDCENDLNAEGLTAVFLMEEIEIDSDFRGPNVLVLHGLVVCSARNPESHACQVARMQTGRDDLYERVGTFLMRSPEQKVAKLFENPTEEMVIV